MRNYLTFAIVICLLSLTASAWAVTPWVEKMRVGQHGAKTRLVLEISSPIKPKMFTLTKPNRVVLDFPKLKFKPDLPDFKQPPNSVIEGMRQGIFKPGVVRMVLDTKQKVTPSIFGIPAKKGFKYRLVIDLNPTGKIAKHKPKTTYLSAQKYKKLAPVVRPRPTKLKNEPFIIVLDPGHGGVDPGAHGLKRTYEKTVVLQIAKRLKTHLNRIPNTKIYLTRNTDKFVKLGERTLYAQRRDADLFISLHADAHKVRSVRGASVYVLSEKSSDREAARLARSENSRDMLAGVNIQSESPAVRNILIDLAQRETMNKSALLAAGVIANLTKIARMRKKHVLFAGFKVLKAPETPSILVELAYLSNPTEEKLLKSTRHQEKLAKAIASGVRTYISKR